MKVKLIISAILLWMAVLPANAQTTATGTIRGTVKDEHGNGVPFCPIAIGGTKYGTATDENGNYSIKKVAAGNYELVFVGIGYDSSRQPIVVKAGEVLQTDFKVTTKSVEVGVVQVKGIRSISGIAHLDEVKDGVIYSGKKNEVIVLDSLNANTAQNNPRQVLGRVPGINFSETEGSGFPSNGIGMRGLNPAQSVEMNNRQNGYNIVADIYGYPESYYQTPLEAVERIEVTRGAASLQFGPQFGGVINYVTKKGPDDKPFEFTTQQTAGSYYMFNSFNSIGGTYKKLNYYGFIDYSSNNGWRPNSDYRQFSGFAKLQFQISKKVSLSAEYTALRNKIHMPGGLSDDQYNDDNRASFRQRNWITTPWNILSLTLDYQITPQTNLNIKSTFMKSARDLIWRNEDGGPSALDTIDPATNQYVPRELEHEGFLNTTTEIRLSSNYNLARTNNTVAAGVRIFAGRMKQQGGGEGSTGSDMDLNLYGDEFEYSYTYTSINIAPFIENTFRITNRFSLTPGVRLEFIRSTSNGYNDEDGTATNASRSRFFPLFGLGAQYKVTRFTNIYANCSQAYKPIEYSSLIPFGSNSKIDPNLKDASGFNADLGWRGTYKNFLNFDVSGFFLWYHNRAGLVTLTDDTGNPYTLRTNTDDSRHVGAETYVELNLVKLFTQSSKGGSLSIFNSFAYIDASYIKGEFKGNQVEYAPKVINRLGVTYSIRDFSLTFQWSYTDKSFGDANNTVRSEDAVVGLIPSYHVLDLSASYHFLKHYNLKAGMNNLADAKYMTKRTDEYPGPGIIPAIGRTFYISVGAKF